MRCSGAGALLLVVYLDSHCLASWAAGAASTQQRGGDRLDARRAAADRLWDRSTPRRCPLARGDGLDGGAAAVGGDGRAGDVAGAVGGQKGDDLGDLLR